LAKLLSKQQEYYLGTCEVTQDEFQRVTQRNPSEFSPGGKLRKRVAGIDTNRLPVDSVCWFDAIEFCDKLSALPAERSAGRSYRLPTETEWEFAARAGSDDKWCFGEDRKKLHEYAWFGFEKCGMRTHCVGEKKPNRFGLFDMYGNVWEWCQDSRLPPLDAAKKTRADAASTSHIIRGGGWMSEPGRCNSSYGTTDPASIGDTDSGFRVVLVCKPPAP
jgi:formylglycine-generating enzyme required for sulfatase activity